MEERDLFLASLYEEKANVRELRKDINGLKLKQLAAVKDVQQAPDLTQSVESVKRLGFELT